MAIFAIPLAFGAQFISKDIMILIAGKDFVASGAILKILILAASLIFLGNIFAHAIIAINKQKKIIKAYIFVAITSLAGYLIFIPSFSYFGAALVTIYSELFIALASIYLIKKYTDFVPSANVLIKAFLASFLMSASIYLVQNYISQNIYFVLGTGILSYGAFIYLFRGIRKEDVLDLIGKE
jgi:O-antigen/teichoic acid export membrane protein